jgi:hypothetical protein
LGVRYLILPPATRPPRGGQWQLVRGDRHPGTALSADSRSAAQSSLANDVRLWKNTAPLPRAWIVRQIDWLPPLQSRQPADVAERTADVLFPDGEPRDFRTSSAVEAHDSPGALKGLVAVLGQPTPQTKPDAAARDHCRIVSAEPDCVQIEAQVAGPGGLLVVSDLYYPGWMAEVESADGATPVPILRTNRVMRGVALPAGEHSVTFRYRPPSVFWGAAVSGAAWLALLGGAVLRIRRCRATST